MEKEFNLEEYKEEAIVQLRNLKTYTKAVSKNCDIALDVMRRVENKEQFDAAVERWPEIGQGVQFMPPQEDEED